MEFVIIGGVAAGMSAASKIARMLPGSVIRVFEAGSHISYGACGLPYYVSGDNTEEGRLFIRGVEEFKKQGIDVSIRCRVVKVEPGDRKVMVRSLDTGDLDIVGYDRLLIASGASSVMPKLPGIELPGVYALKTVEDARALKNAAASAGSVVVVGGGYIGVEVCEAAVKLGKQVTLIEGAERILGGFSGELSALAQEELEGAGVLVRTGEMLKRIEGDGAAREVVTNQGSYRCDMVIVALGLKPNTAFLRDSGIRMAENGAIEVDRYQRTSISDIYAAGDCSMVYNRITGKNAYIPLGTVANKCGRIAGENMSGSNVRFEGALGSAAIKVLDLELARTGITPLEAKEMGVRYGEATVKASSGPPYYPSPTPIIMRLVYDMKTGRILGGCAGGRKGAVLRIDALASAITGGLTLKELGQADFCYAPPFAEVWDVLNIAANYAESKRISEL